MPQSRMTNNGYGLSIASPVENSKDLILWNIEQSLKIENEYTSVLQEVKMLQDLFLPEQNFFYKIQCFDSPKPGRKLIRSERGVGEIYKRYRKFYLKREYSTHLEDAQGERKSGGYLVDFPQDGFIVCYSYIPESFLDLLVYPNSVVCSINQHSPTPVELEERTLLGRLDDRIQSIDSNELRAILTDENIIDAVSSSPVLNLNSPQARLSTAAIQIRPVYSNSNHPNPLRGTIVYNAESNRFEGFDGANWRPLKWGDE